ncbi:hypothetical protein [uncultured Shewanella sp.]|uniref:hypothetical protein n=1 Tax=uncultured Shewanella sp. TaxID=173975 RepID=UPI002619871C|nr:hypothetical protein [uncultured Shewanella sp.]
MEFLKGAKDFARNPLGIVALFISLIYGFASLLLGASADKLESLERWPLLVFVVTFPFVVLYVFYKLVTEHHGKLYSPGDYKDDDSFLRTLSPEEKEKKLENDAKEATGDVFIEKAQPSQRASFSATKTRIQQAEKHVINMLSAELGVTPNIDVQISTEKYTFDAAYFKPGSSATILEVKYYSQPRITFKAVQEFVYRAKLAAEYMTIDTKFILALVLDGDTDKFQLIADAWSKSLEDSGLNIELRVISGEEVSA